MDIEIGMEQYKYCDYTVKNDSRMLEDIFVKSLQDAVHLRLTPIIAGG